MEKAKTSITLREVTGRDCDLLWKWRNELGTRASALHGSKIQYSTHEDWFARSLLDNNRHMWIVVNDKKNPVGQIRIDIRKCGDAEIDISIDREFRGRGYGTSALRLVAKKAFSQYKLEKLIASIKKNNIRSISTFRKAGFKFLEETIDVVKMVLGGNT